MYNVDRAIVAQNSATAAAGIVSALISAGVEVDVLSDFDSFRTHIFEGTLALADGVVAGQTESEVRTPTRTATRSSGGGGQSNDAGAGVSLKFGKHAGKTIAAVYAADPDYIQWLADTSNNEFIKGKAAEYLASVN